MPRLLEKEPRPNEAVYRPSDTEQKLIAAIWRRWMAARDQRQQTYRYFNDRSLISYVSDAVDRFNGYIEPREDPAADWGAKVFNNVTRSKCISIIAHITAERIRSEFFPSQQRNEEDLRLAQLIKRLDDHAAEKNRDEEQQLFSVLEATVKGTVIGYEGYKRDRRKIKEIKGYDPETGKIDYREKEIVDWDDVYSEIVPLFDFYPGNIRVRDIQKQPFVIWRNVLDKDVFLAEFEKYKNVQFVRTRQEMLGLTEEDRSLLTQDGSSDVTKALITETVLDQQVEVVRYFNRWTDEFHILANGILLTPHESPFPWDHKFYPFWSMIFEPFAHDFFYGKSLPDKVRSNQDVLNDLYRMLLDQSFLSINPPMITSGMESLKDEMLWPGRRMVVDDASQTKAMEIPTPQPAHIQIIKMVEEAMKKESLDDPSSGISGSRVSAFEVGVAKEAAQKLLSIFVRMTEYGVWQKTRLRVRNMLQFYSVGMVEEVAGEEFVRYRRFSFENATLPDGTRGQQIIQIVGDENELPHRETITKAELWYLAHGQNLAFSFLTKDSLRNIDLKIKIIPNSSLKMSEALRRALELDFQKTAQLLYPDLLNREEAWREFNVVFDKDPEKMTGNAGAQGIPGMPPGGAPGLPPTSGPSMGTQNSASQAGIPSAQTDQNSLRNIPAG